MSSRRVCLVLLATVLVPAQLSTASAQSFRSQALFPAEGARRGAPLAPLPVGCGFNETNVEYGDLTVGSEVTLQRHRFVRGEANWDHEMAPFLGRSARITRLSGVDAQGCAGVRVDVDGGSHFWRARDLGTASAAHEAPDAQEAVAGFPQECHVSDNMVNYGAATVGATVVLGRHRPVDGESNWSDAMEPFVGRPARVVSAASVDNVGCPGVHVDIDDSTWFWRVRDLRPVGSEGPDLASVLPTDSIGDDHGRPVLSGIGAGGGLFGVGGVPGPQACGVADGGVQWGSMQVGSEVRLNHHRAVAGDENWDAGMDSLVGGTAAITELVGVDDQGCAVVHIDADQGRFFWRARDLVVLLPPVPPERQLPTACGLRAPDFGPLTVGARITLGQHTPYTGPSAQAGIVAGDTNWVEEMGRFVGQSAVVTRLDGIDAAGCTVVRVDADSGQFAWRIRDAQRAE